MWALVLTALAVALALLCWPVDLRRAMDFDTAAVTGVPGNTGVPAVPAVPAVRAVRAVLPGVAPGRWAVGGICIGAATIWAVAGPAVALSAGLLLTTVAGLTRAELRRRRAASDLTELLASVRMLAREMRSGAGPLVAVTGIAAVAATRSGPAGRLLEQLAAVVVTDSGRESSRATTDPDLVSEIGDRLATAWALSARYGVPWVGLVDALAEDLADRVRVTSVRAAQVSGPRVSGYVLAVMPAVGLLLGMGMGADPVGILLGTGTGHLLLVIGCALTCAGLCWTARIVRG